MHREVAETPRKVVGKFSPARGQAIFMAGQELGIPVDITKEESDSVELAIGTGYEKDLSEFWNTADKIKAPPYKTNKSVKS